MVAVIILGEGILGWQAPPTMSRDIELSLQRGHIRPLLACRQGEAQITGQWGIVRLLAGQELMPIKTEHSLQLNPLQCMMSILPTSELQSIFWQPLLILMME